MQTERHPLPLGSAEWQCHEQAQEKRLALLVSSLLALTFFPVSSEISRVTQVGMPVADAAATMFFTKASTSEGLLDLSWATAAVQGQEVSVPL